MKEKKDTYDDLLASSNNSLYEQSSKVSSISRGLVYAIIATIWAVSYENGSFSFPKEWLLAAICLCGAFLVIDLTHYFIDTCFHYKQAQSIFWHKKLSDVSTREDAIKYARNAKVSFIFLVTKFVIVLIIISSFVVGVILNV